MRRVEMTKTGMSGVSAAIARTLSAAVALLQDGSLSSSHSTHLPAIVPGVLAPLILPRMGASIRRALSSDPKPGSGRGTGAERSSAPAIRFDSLTDMARENVRLSRELEELKA